MNSPRALRGGARNQPSAPGPFAATSPTSDDESLGEAAVAVNPLLGDQGSQVAIGIPSRETSRHTEDNDEDEDGLERRGSAHATPPSSDVDGAKPPTDFSKHRFMIAYRKASYWWSTALLVIAVFVILYGIGSEWNNPPWDQGSTHPAFEIVLFLALLFWIAILEGAQVSIVGLKSVDITAFRHTHPRSYRCCELVHRGPNVERFIVGRQFLLLFIVFIVSRIGGAGDMPSENFYIGSWEWSSEANDFFWVNSVLLMVVIVVPGQLVSQLLAAGKMLAFLELPFAPYYTVVLPSLALESVGITHTSYVLKDLFVSLSGADTSGDSAKKMTKNALYYARCVMSVCLVIFSAVLVVKGLFAKQTNATNGVGWDKLPGWAAFVLTVFFMFVIGCCEGFQIAAVTLSKLPLSEFRTKAPVAFRTTQMLFAGRNMQAFLVGRGTLVAMMMVLLAKVTSYAGKNGELVTGDDWGLGAGFNEGLLQTGILGAVFVVNVGQLSFRMMASCFPVMFINNWVLYGLLRIALLVEATGVVNSCWPLAWGLDAALGLEPDDFGSSGDVETPAQMVVARKRSLGIPTQKGVSPFDLHQPEAEFHVASLPGQFKMSYV